MTENIDREIIEKISKLKEDTHPSASVLHKAVKLTRDIRKLSAELEADYPALHNQVLMHERNLISAIQYLEPVDHKLAFIGSIGVGKTTAICHLFDLLVGDKTLLSTGSGRTTVCEVIVDSGDTNSIEIDPVSESELRSYIEDFAEYLLGYSGKSKSGESEGFKLSAEIERCLRNMTNLKIEKKKVDGKIQRTDQAKQFVELFSEKRRLVEELWNRLQIENRCENKLTFLDNEKQHPFEWLQTEFAKINGGRNPNASLPKRLILTIDKPFFNDSNLSITLVDTKGIDETTNREDLTDQIKNHRTAVILCSGFNDAPNKATTGILRNSIEVGLESRIPAETGLLILDRGTEAEDVEDLDGPVGDVEEGRDIRREQVRNELEQALKLNDIALDFFNAKKDSPVELRERILDRIQRIRKSYEDQIEEIEGAIIEVTEQRENALAKAAHKQVSETIRTWLEDARSLKINVGNIYEPLVDNISDTGIYAASVRASVNRSGEWYNLNYYYELSSNARKYTVRIFDGKLRNLRAIAENLLDQKDLRAAHKFLRQLIKNIEQRIEVIYEEAAYKGREMYENELRADDDLWYELQNEWGQGPGYKDRVSSNTNQWFDLDKPDVKRLAISNLLKGKWKVVLNEVESML